MDRHERKIDELITSAGGAQVRQRKHRVYRFADGRVFVRSSTPSDRRASLNTISNLKRFLAAPGVAKTTSAPTIPHILPFEPHKRKRMVQSPGPGRSDAPVIVPALGKVHRQERRVVPQFKSLDDLLTAADQVDDYWKLCASGRVRTLQKLASSHFKTNTSTVIASRLDVENLNAL